MISCVCTHRLGAAGQGDVPDLLADELQLGVVPLPLPLLGLQTRDQVSPEKMVGQNQENRSIWFVSSFKDLFKY